MDFHPQKTVIDPKPSQATGSFPADAIRGQQVPPHLRSSLRLRTLSALEVGLLPAGTSW